MQRTVQAALGVLLFYAVYVALAGASLPVFGLSIVCVVLLVGALHNSNGQCVHVWFFSSVLCTWLLYLLASFSQPLAPFVHWWPLPMMASTMLLAIRQWFSLAVAILAVLTLTTSGQHQVNFLHLVGLPFMSLLILSLYLALVRHKMSHALEQALGTDLVTGCDNKVRLQQLLQVALETHQRYAIQASIVVLHVGLTPGGRPTDSDAMLHTLCTIWRSRLRATDRLCRLSDDRFVCLLANTPPDKAGIARDDLLKAAEYYEFEDRGRVRFSSTIIDIAEIDGTVAGMEKLLAWQCQC